MTIVSEGIKSATRITPRLGPMEARPTLARRAATAAGRLGNCEGRRERKKRQTRDALITAALDLFERHGFDRTTIDEIADAVDVSPRTFFRYFASKEEVALGFLDDQYTAVFAALDRRPAGEPVLTSLRHATGAVIAEWERGGTSLDHARFACLVRIKRSSPTLMASAMEQGRARLNELAARIARRMGVHPETDPRPKLVASTALCAIQTTVDAWRENDPESAPSVLIDRAFALLEQGINYPAAPAAAPGG